MPWPLWLLECSVTNVGPFRCRDTSRASRQRDRAHRRAAEPSTESLGVSSWVSGVVRLIDARAVVMCNVGMAVPGRLRRVGPGCGYLPV